MHATLVGMLKCRYFVAARKGRKEEMKVQQDCVDTNQSMLKGPWRIIIPQDLEIGLVDITWVRLCLHI